MRKNFKYRMYPSKKQIRQLNASLSACRFVWNNFLSERKTKYEKEKITLTMYDQLNTLPDLKQRHLFLKNAHSQCLQNVGTRIDLAFKAFFRRIKQGATPGFPRFKGDHRFHSITFPQYGNGCKVASDGKNMNICLSKIGSIPLVYHRNMVGTPKTVNIKRTTTGKWFVSISCEYDPTLLPDLGNSVGVDMGLKTFATMSDGTKIENPRFFKKEAKAIAKAQSKRDKLAKGSSERKHAHIAVARIHERTAWKRENFCHQESRKLVNKYQNIFFEELDIQAMQQDNGKAMNRSIADVAWNQFTSMTEAKAVEAGRNVIFVNPAFTSQDCSRCGKREPKNLSNRLHSCICGLLIDRDLNASLNVLRLGTQSLGKRPRSLCL